MVPPLFYGEHQTALNVTVMGDDWFASGGDDGNIWLWSSEDFLRPPQQLTGHTEPVVALAASNDNQWLASGSQDTTIRLWSITSETPNEDVITLSGHEAGSAFAGFYTRRPLAH